MRNSPTRLLVLVLLLTVALLSAAVVHAASATIRVEPVKAPAAKVAEVPITLEGSPGIAAMHLELTYDPAVLAVDSIEPGSLAAGNALMAFNTDEPGRIVISLAAADDIAGDGTLALVSFLVVGEKGQTSALDLEYPQAWNDAGFEVAVDLQPGEFTVGSSGLGLLLLAFLGLLAVALVLLLVVLIDRRRRRRRPATAAPAYAQPSSRQPAAAPQSRPLSGEQAPGPKFCGNCGQALEPGKRFCIHCGDPVGG